MSNPEKTPIGLLPPAWVIMLILLAAGGWVLYELKELVFLLVVSYALAYFLDPWLEYLEERGIGRGIGFFLIISIMVITLIVAASIALPVLIEEYKDLSANFPQYFQVAREKFITLLEYLRSHVPDRFQDKLDPAQIEAMLPKIGEKTASGIFSGMKSVLFQGYSLTLTVFNLLLLPFLTYYLALDFRGWHRKMLWMVPAPYQEKVSEICGEIDRYLSSFVRGQLLVATVLFLLYAAGLGLVGVKLWFLLAVISGFGNIVPYVGGIVGLVTSTVMALVTFGDFTHVLLVWAVFAIVQFLEGMVITPRILGEKVGLSPLVVILSVVAGGILFGLIGVFLAVPGAAVVRVLGKHFHRWVVDKTLPPKQSI